MAISGEMGGAQELFTQANPEAEQGTAVARRAPAKYRRTILFAVTALIVMAIAASVAATKVNGVIAGLAEGQLIGLAEENTTRDALHIQSMVTSGQSMIGMNHSTAMAPESGMDHNTAMAPESGMDDETAMVHESGMDDETAMVPESGMNDETAMVRESGMGHDDPTAHSAGGSMAMGESGDGMASAMMTDAQTMATVNAPLSLELLKGPMGLPMHFEGLVAGLGVVESSLYDPQGIVIWSTNLNAVGTTGRDSAPIDTAALGTITSKLVKDRDVVGADGAKRPMDVVETFVPLQDTPGSPVIGVLEINREVGTELGLLVDDTKSTVVWTTVGTMAGLFLALVGFVVVSDRNIFQSNQRQMVLVENQLAEREESERKLSEHVLALETSNAELEAFSYSVSHDLRGPLRTIDGFSKALLEDHGDKLDEEGHDFLGRVRAGSQRMGMLIDAMLQMSRASRGEMYREEVDLSEMARTIMTDFESDEPKRRVDAVIANRVNVVGDARLLRGVMQNLLGNAWKFTSSQEHATIEFGVNDQDGEKVYFIRDDGAGFEMEFSDKLFGAFQRLHATTEFEGTGVGLATAQRIIHRHGGRIWAEGAVGKGATFYFTI